MNLLRTGQNQPSAGGKPHFIQDAHSSWDLRSERCAIMVQVDKSCNFVPQKETRSEGSTFVGSNDKLDVQREERAQATIARAPFRLNAIRRGHLR